MGSSQGEGLRAERDPDEGELLRRVQAGDREAFGRLVERHMRGVYAAALGIVARHDLALDLSQEAFVRAYAARETLDPERPLFPWLYRVVRNLALNALRDRREVTTNGAEAFVAREDGDPARAAERAEERDRCRAAIASLPPREREALVLRELQGLKYREIADLLEVPLGTVMSRLYSARRRLALALEEGR